MEQSHGTSAAARDEKEAQFEESGEGVLACSDACCFIVSCRTIMLETDPVLPSFHRLHCPILSHLPFTPSTSSSFLLFARVVPLQTTEVAGLSCSHLASTLLGSRLLEPTDGSMAYLNNRL